MVVNSRLLVFFSQNATKLIIHDSCHDGLYILMQINYLISRGASILNVVPNVLFIIGKIGNYSKYRVLSNLKRKNPFAGQSDQ